MKTLFMLMAQYDGRAVIPIEQVRDDYFGHLQLDKLIRKINTGEIKLPLARMDPSSQKTPKAVHLEDLAKYIDDRRAAGLKELEQISS